MENVLKDTDFENQFKTAKSYLLKLGKNSQVTLYDHLVDLIADILERKPDVVSNLLEECSWNLKKKRFQMERDCLQDKEKVTSKVAYANLQKGLLNFQEKIVKQNNQDHCVLADIMESAYYFEQAGVGLGKEETFLIFLALRQLVNTYKLKSCRFWGKIFGIHKNYIVAEVELYEKEKANQDQSKERQSLHESNDNNFTDQPSLSKKIIEVPEENDGQGCNSKVYFVCNDAGSLWQRLPPVTPKQITVARQVRKLLTGYLDAEVICYPPFPGNEANFLRATIARISASTHISPQGYYMFEENEGNDDEDDGRSNAEKAFIQNMEFEGIPISDLSDPSNTFWVHHCPYILPQGRTVYFNPNASVSLNASKSEGVEEEEGEEEISDDDEVPIEVGPSLLTSVSEDKGINLVPPWSASKSGTSFQQYAIAVMRSNIWPGAYSFAVDKIYCNIYIGYGLRYCEGNFNPAIPPSVQDEYSDIPKVTECDDPTVEQERSVKVLEEEVESMDEEESDDSEDDY
ncbi:radial spoke head protein 4 homolog A isoform X3 [Hydra vulgaris]|uniref:Radial spoke head protein 4 homolog A isoform X3 n=1 Tax=Hydra vulgaris TaxID=6087 RepID=A0ABM4CFN7_HYDVU